MVALLEKHALDHASYSMKSGAYKFKQLKSAAKIFVCHLKYKQKGGFDVSFG